jgi:hypothetical protein
MIHLHKLFAISIVGSIFTAQAALSAEITNKLSISGFIDMSTVTTKVDGGETISSSALDQFELTFGYDFGDGLTFTVDVENQNSTSELEQAFMTYSLTDSVSIKAGRFLSYSGWETEEPTGLFQYSGTGYAPFFYGYYQEGVSLYAAGETVDFAISVVNDIFALGDDISSPGIEMAVAYHPSDAFTAKAFYMTDEAVTGEDITMINAWAAYSMGDLTLAAEINASENTVAGLNEEADGYLLMANYAIGDYGVTFRYHEYEVEDANGVTTNDGSAFTLAASYAVTENLLLVTEYRMDEDDFASDSDTFALEALITF